MTYYLSAAYAKHLLSRLSIYLDRFLEGSKTENPIHVCVQISVAVGNNKSARLIVSTHIWATIHILRRIRASPLLTVESVGSTNCVFEWDFGKVKSWESYTRVRAGLSCRRQQQKCTPELVTQFVDSSGQQSNRGLKPLYIIVGNFSHFSLLTRSRKHLCRRIKWLIEVFKTSKIENPIHVCVQDSVAVGNNKSARLSVPVRIS